MRTRTVQVTECSDHWECSTGEGSTGESFHTAAEAERALRREDESLASLGTSAVTTIEWEWSTYVGGLVVRAICAEAQARRRS